MENLGNPSEQMPPIAQDDYPTGSKTVNSADVNSPASPEAQARVDQLIDHVNQKIELLDLDDPEPPLLRRMVQSLVDPRRATRLSLIESLSQIGEPATPFLLEGLAVHRESVVRRACCNALTNIGDAKAVEGLISALLRDDDIGVKSAAAGALAKVGAPAFEPLKLVLASDQASESCKGHAAWAMASMGSEVSEQLFRCMRDASAAVRTAAVGAIAQMAQRQRAQKQQEPVQSPRDLLGQSTLIQSSMASQTQGSTVSSGKSGARSLKPNLTSQPSQPSKASSKTGQPSKTGRSSKTGQSSKTRQSTSGASSPRLPAQSSLDQKTGRSSAKPASDPSPVSPKILALLTEALSDQSAEVRIEAAANLARLNCQKAYHPLVACLKDPTPEVRRAAVLALGRLANTEAIDAISPLTNDVEPPVRKVAALVIAQLESLKAKAS